MKVKLGEIYKTSKGGEMLIVADITKIAKARKFNVFNVHGGDLFIAVEIEEDQNEVLIDAYNPQIIDDEGRNVFGGAFLTEHLSLEKGML